MALANSIMFTTYALYYVNELGLNPFQLVLVGTFLELVIFLLEIPTGVFADTYSRRLSVIIAFFIMGAAYILEGNVVLISESLLQGAVSLFVLVVLAEMIRGVGETFLSGAQQSWITDEVGEERIGRLFVRAGQFQQIASITGIILSVVLSTIALNLPYVIGGGLYVGLAVYLLIAMKETNFRAAARDDLNSWSQMRATFKEGSSFVNKSPVLLLILIVSLFSGASSEGFDRLWEAHFITDIGLPTFNDWNSAVWFGIFGICGMLLGLLTNEVVIRRINLENRSVVRNLMLILVILKIICVIAFGLAPNLVWALASFWLLGMFNSVFYPLYSAWLNQHIESGTRSTVLSFLSQANAIGQTAGGPVIGWAGVRYTIRVSIVLSAVMLVPLVFVFQKLRRQKENG
ncbi:Major Facilitator Superfamily protein [Paenibacillus sp. OV219]|nr:Major Facilitator Superfamily protein [Paenibacillus sp. OV219]